MQPAQSATAGPAEAGSSGPRSATAEATPLALNSKPDPAAFRLPLDVIVSDHFNQRLVCERLEAMVAGLEQGKPTREMAAEVLTFMTGDLVAHTADEEDGLFPLLEKRCLPEDRLGEILGQLTYEHQLDDDLVEFLTDDLSAMAEGRMLPNPQHFAINATVYAKTQTRHLAWENRVVIPLARRRLTSDDLEQLGRDMATRRGVDLG